MKKDSIFDKIDKYYEKQPNSNLFSMTVFLCVLVFGYLIYDYTYEQSEEYLTTEKEGLISAENKLKEIDDFLLEQQLNSTVLRLKQSLENNAKEKKKVDDDNSYIKNKLQEASKLLYNQKNWSEFISRINQLAKKYNVELNDVKSNVNNLSNGDVKEAFNVTFLATGNYQGIIHFINQLERSVEVVDVSSLKINRPINDVVDHASDRIFSKSKRTYSIQADVKVSIWGIKY